MKRTLLCAAGELLDGVARGFEVEGLEVVLVRHAGVVRAFENKCPHRGTTLDWAPNRFMSDDGKHLQCATHAALFRPEDGFCVQGPCVGQSLRELAVEVVEGDIWLVAYNGIREDADG